MTISIRDDGAVRVVTIERPAVRNAVDGPMAAQLARAFRELEESGLRGAFYRATEVCANRSAEIG